MLMTKPAPSKPHWLMACVAVLFSMLSAGAGMAQGGRSNDAYRPPAEPEYETQGGQGNRFGSQAYGQSGGQPASLGGSQSSDQSGGGYGRNTYGQPQTYGNQTYGARDGQPYPSNAPYQPQPPYQAPSGDGRGYANNSDAYGSGGPRANDAYRGPSRDDGYGEPYSPPPVAEERGPRRYTREDGENPNRGYYLKGEIADKGRGFFGSISQGLASAIEYTYQKAGRPNGYILGEDGGGAFFAGLRYGEGLLYTKDAGDHKVFWQGPSLGYDVGGEGSKVMVLVYNLADPAEVFHRFGGVEGSAYLVGGVSVQFQKSRDVTMAVIRSGVGLRLGANVGYLKYTRTPTWNPF